MFIQWADSSLVWIMAYHEFGTKPLHAPVLNECPSDRQVQTPMPIWSTYGKESELKYLPFS